MQDSYGLNNLGEPLTPSEMTEKYGLSVIDIIQIRDKAITLLQGVTALTSLAQGRTSRGGDREITDAEIDQALTSHNMPTRERVRVLSSSLAAKAIAQTLGISGWAVYAIQKKLVSQGVLVDPVRGSVAAKKYKPRLKELYNARATYKQMASELPLSECYIGKLILKLIRDGDLQDRNLSRDERIRLASPPSIAVTQVAQWLETNRPNVRFWKKVKAVHRGEIGK